jgi:restriction endonuclease Mrr
VRPLPKPITLVDGAKLARLMIEHGVGVKSDGSSARTKLDEGYLMRLRGSRE